MMRFVVPVLAALLVASCKPAPAGSAPTSTSGSAQDARGGGPRASSTVAAPMPDFPSISTGAMHLVSAGAEDLTVEAPAKAGFCEQPGVLLVESNQGRLGVLLVLALPARSDRVGRYPVSYSVTGPATLPTPPAAQLALQQVTQKGVLGYQALEGNVEVYGFGANVSGRFQVTVREISSERLVRVAGTFSEVPVESQPRAYCERFTASPTAPQPGARH